MSLTIEGMNMPEYRDVFGDKRGCVYLLMLTVNKDGTAYLQFNDVEGGFYQVKELPTPHGRLIDADRIYDLVENRYRMSCGIEHRCERDLLDLICEMPTIIEAEVSE